MAFICPKEPGGATSHHRMHRDKAQVQKKKKNKREKQIQNAWLSVFRATAATNFPHQVP